MGNKLKKILMFPVKLLFLIFLFPIILGSIIVGYIIDAFN